MQVGYTSTCELTFADGLTLGGVAVEVAELGAGVPRVGGWTLRRASDVSVEARAPSGAAHTVSSVSPGRGDCSHLNCNAHEGEREKSCIPHDAAGPRLPNLR